jgi:glucosamine--fructose-6-phosphate aminotransferase (isomerizing)
MALDRALEHLAPMADQTLMEQETREIPAVAANLAARGGALSELGERLRVMEPRLALAAGRGSSDAVALLTKYLLETRLGLPTVSVAPSVHSIYGARLRLDDALLFAISQSGRSPDLVEFCRAATGRNALRLGLINDITSPLASAVDIALPLLAGPEKSIAATKSCVAAMTLVLGLIAHWRQDAASVAAFDRAADVFSRALASDWSGADAFLDADGPVYVVGRGTGLAIAAEAALKLKETSGLHAESISAAEIRHGPYALAGPRLRAIIFAQRDATFAGLKTLATDLLQQGASVLLISPDASLPGVHVPADDEPVLELTSMLARFHLFANAAAIRRGRSPDRPPMLSKITETR